jgi:hypothetical protein
VATNKGIVAPETFIHTKDGLHGVAQVTQLPTTSSEQVMPSGQGVDKEWTRRGRGVDEEWKKESHNLY